jgi:hypothetical protein
MRRFLPFLKFKRDASGHWITNATGERYYCWLHFGPVTSPDGIRIWNLVIWRWHLAWGWRRGK